MLIEKLQTFGVEGDKLVWFIDYLLGRSQIVAMNNVKSIKEGIYCGVPQGSIIGPCCLLCLTMTLQTIFNIAMSPHMLMIP